MGYYEFGELGDMVTDIVSAIQGMTLLVTLIAVICIVVPYFVHGYVIMCTGRKARLQKDFMPFLPIARQLYQMQIADCPWWYVFFFGSTTITCGSVSLISFLLAKLTGKMVIVSVLLFIYVIANMVFTFLYYRKFYESFGFNPNTACLNIIPNFGFVALTFTFLIAFSNAIRFGKYVEPGVDIRPRTNEGPRDKGVVVGILGTYKDATFDMVDGATLVFGRSPQDSNIVFDQLSTDISRKHCTVVFDAKTNQYTVVDSSSNGTYLENGSRLEQGQPKQLSRGTAIYLGSSKKNGFRLN